MTYARHKWLMVKANVFNQKSGSAAKLVICRRSGIVYFRVNGKYCYLSKYGDTKEFIKCLRKNYIHKVLLVQEKSQFLVQINRKKFELNYTDWAKEFYAAPYNNIVGHASHNLSCDQMRVNHEQRLYYGNWVGLLWIIGKRGFEVTARGIRQIPSVFTSSDEPNIVIPDNVYEKDNFLFVSLPLYLSTKKLNYVSRMIFTNNLQFDEVVFCPKTIFSVELIDKMGTSTRYIIVKLDRLYLLIDNDTYLPFDDEDNYYNKFGIVKRYGGKKEFVDEMGNLISSNNYYIDNCCNLYSYADSVFTQIYRKSTGYLTKSAVDLV